MIVVDGDIRLSAAAVDDLVARMAGGLRARGTRPGDVVAWQLPNRWEVVVLYRACWRLGAIAAPVHHLLSPADVDAALSHVQPRLVVEAADLERLLDAEPVHDGAAKPSDIAVALFTSGSSGPPKAALHTQEALFYKGRLMTGVHGVGRDDAVLMPAPLAHISGLLNAVLLPEAAGMKVVLQRRWDPDEAARLIETEAVTVMMGPPTFFHDLRQAATPVRSLRLVSCGGTGVTPDFVDETARAFRCVVKRTYGSTEAPTVTTAHAGDPAHKARSTDGRPTGSVELRIDEHTGELLVRGPEVFVGYTDPDRTAAAFDDDRWFRTGDTGTIDDDGWLTVTGRCRDVIIRGGENIAMAEIGAVCEAHRAVRQAVAFGLPDERLGQRVAVAVVLAHGAAGFDIDECRRWFSARGVATFKTPEVVTVVDALPMLAAGKPDRRALAQRLATRSTGV
ncbi:MAG: class I adenylate-forming enzyme family protein [Acidimicrobiales bacterium]